MNNNHSKVLVIGDSHTRALSKAYSARNTHDDAISLQIQWLIKASSAQSQGDISFDEAIEQISQLKSSDILVVTFAGTLHNIFGLLRHETPFDIFSEHDKISNIEEGVQIIPEGVFADLFYEKSSKNIQISRMKAAATCAAFHLSTPPPKENNQYIEARVSKYRDQILADVGLNSPSLRLKLWKLEMKVLEKICMEWGLKLIPPPLNTQTNKGFLKPEFYGNDATHANEAYGELVLQQLQALCSGLRAFEE